ncbi:hypothetical protein M405DRAFT_34037 [Rhizopogon salebrosus TDB-379]|nr:hypothetical protein M405DRAFT_34037 [Rhizopogon salebrosus TDB-379]
MGEEASNGGGWKFGKKCVSVDCVALTHKSAQHSFLADILILWDRDAPLKFLAFPIFNFVSIGCLRTFHGLKRDSHEIEEPDANQPNESNATDSSIGVTEQADNENVEIDDGPTVVEAPLAECPWFDGKIQVFNSASSTFYTPSDRSGIGGVRREHIRACPLWRNEAPRNDCVFINTGAGVQGMAGMDVARILCFFFFFHVRSGFVLVRCRTLVRQNHQ